VALSKSNISTSLKTVWPTIRYGFNVFLDRVILTFSLKLRLRVTPD